MFVGRRIALGAFVVALTALFVVSGVAVAAPAVPASASHAAGFGTSAPASLTQKVLAELRAAHVPMSEAFLPNFGARMAVQNGTIQPDYLAAPAPMGIGDLGVRDIGGHDVGTVSYTSSVEASISIDSLNSTYVDGYGPDSVSIQLNSVLTHVDLFNRTVGQFWIQNVPVYVESTHRLFFVDNVWNFSSPAFDLTTSSLWSYKGTPVPPVYYFANGPQFLTGFPFTIHVWNNASIVNDRPTVFLNYSVTLSNGSSYAGSYDRVEFNSTGNARPTGPAPTPTFQIDGQHPGANGALPNDAEIMIGGSGGGSTTSVNDINATMSLATEPNGTSTFVPVPSAYNFGFETGETSEGIAEWTNGGSAPVAHLTAGPSLIGPLWGLKGAVPGHTQVTLHVQPANAFVFASAGSTFHAGAAAWAPLLANGGGSYQLPPVHYTFEIMMSDHATAVLPISASGSHTVVLRADASVGIDTPLYAWGNGELANISSGGAGTLGNPYVLLSGPGTLNPLFGEFNDFEFPVFNGLFLAHTTAFVTVANAPSFLVPYSLPVEAAAIQGAGQPTSNQLQFELLFADHVSLVQDPSIAGWFGSSLSGTMVGDVVLWNSSYDLVANDTFDTASVALFVYGGVHDVVSANTFVVNVPPCPSPGALLGAGGQEGIVLSANGDLVYNNYFALPFPAITPTTNVLTFLPSSYHDTWNVSSAPASAVRTVNGYHLSGNILGGPREGGNYWSIYGDARNPYGVLPFDASGLITHGGDRLPLLLHPLHRVTFTETGLPVGTLWKVRVGGATFASTTSTIAVFDPDGAYGWVALAIPGHTATPSTGAFRVAGANVSVAITWT